ncbi:MAG: hypothetical protein IPN86_03255 [Saprospiraceae bacterium]|nr:hypothetical protein [Saprospiraceae bacterium]
MDDAVTNENRVTLDNHITENNKNSLIKKIDEMLSKNQNDWLKTTFIELLYKDQNNLWLYNNKYKIYDYDTYPSFEDLKTKIETFEIKDKINFLADLKNKNAAVNQYLIDLYSEYFKKEIDDYFWKVYHSTKNSKAENRTEFKDKFIEIIRDTISENFLNVIKNSVSYTPEGGSRTSVNRSDPDYYYLVGLFSPQDWLSFIPMDKHKETPYFDIRNWLENLNSKNCGLLDFTKVFGIDYFDRYRENKKSSLDEE